MMGIPGLLRTLLIVLISLQLHATETDNFTDRDKIKDATVWLNTKMENYLRALEKKQVDCDRRKVFQPLISELGGALWTGIEHWSGDGDFARETPVAKSIYRSIWYRWSNWSRGPFAFYYTPVVYRVGDAVFGDDKLGHFIQTGYEVYRAVQLKKKNEIADDRNLLAKTMDWFFGVTALIQSIDAEGSELIGKLGNYQEAGAWGMTAAGVYSYADIASNDDGFRFWNDLVDGPQPIFRCENNRWKFSGSFRFQDYISPAWDEAYNCSDFKSNIAPLIEEEIKKTGISCPISKSVCRDLSARLGAKAKWLLSPRCRGD